MHFSPKTNRRLWPAGLFALLTACAAPPGGGLAGDPQDSCGPQVVVFVNAGDLFAEPPRRTQPPTAEELAAELTRENAALERLQIAFDALLYCRWTEVRVIRADATSGRFPPAELPQRLTAAEGRLRQDLARASQARDRMQARNARIEAAVEAVSPGTRAAIAGQQAAGRPRAVASAPIVLRVRPDASGPVVGRLPAGTEVSLQPAPGGFVLAEGGGQRGYAPNNAFTLLPAVPVVTGPDRLRSLAATNLARREGFIESVALANRSGLQRFEPAS
ncbi:SH3 domain-containing protein [Sediminicoccus sp. KRV36]|uniref:SH3 domain-containing protein n=1 Tax=Sediminicoccus sp. KRV36 TaxID=3133721 RepID=UPI0020104CEE|nr:SH3 domain-containing protein [Sediminicoccus rosea]UPY37354.1 SH3 domain-containing protein [Sediminicoccus rosea]